MSSSEFMEDIGVKVAGLNPLLPHVAEVIENLEEATANDIQAHLEKDLVRKVSLKDVATALSNGIKLGVFRYEREFKVCREFTTRELKRVKHVGDHLTSSSRKMNAVSMGMDKRERNIMEYVRRQREERRKKLHKKRKPRKLGLGKDYERETELSQFLCHKCRKSIEKELLKESKSQVSSVSNGKMSETRQQSATPTESDSTYPVGSASNNGNFNEKQKPEKSRLLVEKNPLETEPPYYDIFT